MSEDLDKELNDALNAAAPKSTAKQTLRTPPVVAEKVVSEAPRESEAEMYLRIKGEVLADLIREQKKGHNVLAEVEAKEKAAEEMVDFHVNLPVQAANIRIDGREYYHGHTYKIRVSQVSTFLDIQALAWRHDETVQGQRRHAAGARTGNMAINANGQAMSSPIYN